MIPPNRAGPSGHFSSRYDGNLGVCVIPWAVAGAAIGAAGSIGGGLLGSSASGAAAKDQLQAAQQATQAELQMYNQTVAREQPFLTAGTNALTQLQQLLGIGPGGGGATNPILSMLGIGPGGAAGGGINPATFQGSPGYQYQLQQGMNAVTNANAPTGVGGNALRQLQQTGQGLANQNWNQYLGNASSAWQQLLGGIGSIVGLGQNAAGNLGNAAQTVGGQIGSNAIGGGNALAAGAIGSASALTGGANGALNNIIPFLLQQYGSGGPSSSGFPAGITSATDATGVSGYNPSPQTYY